MNLNFWNKWLLLAAICLFNSACQSLTDEDVSVGEEGTLKVKARSAEGEDMVYPLSMYAFSEEGDCVASLIVVDADESIRLSLPAGTYKIVSLAGYSDDYDIPDQPKLEDVVRMVGKAGAEVPLMTGKADVTVGANRESRLEMALSYAVTAIDLVLSGIPSDVEAVSVTFSSFYSSMKMKGDYMDADYTLNLDCSLNPGNQWKTLTKYVFPGSGAETTLSIVMKFKNGEEVIHGYVWRGAPKAGYPYHLQGTYSDAFILNGDFLISGWNEAENVEFTFGTASSPDEGENDETEDDSDVDLSGLPEIGSIWNGAIVADVIETDESGADVLLLSLDEWDATVSEVKDVTFDYIVNGISDWRLPTHEEAATLRSRFSGDARVELNERIAEYDPELYELANGEKERYLCLKNGELYSFQFIGGTSTTIAGEKRSYYVRLVSSYHIEF